MNYYASSEDCNPVGHFGGSMRAKWYNYRTEKRKLIDAPTDYADYIPQDSLTQNLYRALIETGKTPSEAAIHVLEVWIGESKKPWQSFSPSWPA